MIVHKFGGATTKTARGLETLVEVVRASHLEEMAALKRAQRSPKPLRGVVLVVSALGHTTRQLARTAELASNGDLDSAKDQLERTRAQHQQWLDTLQLYDSTKHGVEREFASVLSEMSALAEGLAITRELSNRIRDQFLSSGERLALHLISALLRERGLPVATVDARKVIVTNEDFTRAKPLFAETRERVVKELRPLLEHSRIVVMQGYVGATRDGFTTTLGSESSDLSAALVGASLGAKEIRIWKTVSGIFTADPELVPHAKLLRTLSFAESEEIGRRGARVLFQTAAEPLVETESNIIMRIASTKTAAKRSTVIQKTLPATRLRAAKPLTLVLEPQLIPVRIQKIRPDSSEETKKQLSPKERQLEENFERTLDRASYSWTSERDRLVLVRRELRDEIKRAVNAETHTMREEPGVSTVSLVIRMEDGVDLGALGRQMLKSLRQFSVLSYFVVEHSLVAAVDQTQGVQALKKLHRDFFGS